jgi:hypothetical protein
MKMTELETIKEQKWNNFKRELSKFLYPTIFEQKDDWRIAYEEMVVKHKTLMKTIDGLKVKLSKADNMLEDLNLEILDLKTETSDIDLSKFETTRTRDINGKRMLLSSWLNNRNNIVTAKNWALTNLKFTNDTKRNDDWFVLEIRTKLYSYFGSKDNHVPESKGQDVWQTVDEFITNNFKGDCDDWMTFIYSVILGLAEVYNRENIKDNLFGILTGINYKDGFNWGNHASLLWKHSNNNFYIVETAVSKGSDYIQSSINSFGITCYKNNFRYGRIVFMSNYNTNYYQPRLW